MQIPITKMTAASTTQASVIARRIGLISKSLTTTPPTNNEAISPTIDKSLQGDDLREVTKEDAAVRDQLNSIDAQNQAATVDAQTKMMAFQAALGELLNSAETFLTLNQNNKKQ